MAPDVKQFFARYEQANAASDIPSLVALYADVFMFGGPGGCRSVKKDDFVKIIPRRKEQFALLGLSHSKVTLVEASELDSKYLIARTRWTMSFSKADSTQEIETAATYVLERAGELLTIVMQIDHQDLSAKLQEAKNLR
jgi:ketosteroid isomerase-like protein